MYLKSLKLAGFKSFADRARLEFRPGVTVVVGPNGSGKSNLVDALSWVLGTQATKTLRTHRMEDVIFAGTATRPSLGKAEATLVIDNTERLIDLDLDEVSITRRLYRDGSSDYALNGVGCRLLDIQDLLSDSGVGRHQHVIIGQGEIGRVLNASPEEHRAVIEEAAGILKHRRRKERSERRLERTDEDMVRLTDLLGEINRQMRPLRRQARAAERYEGLKSEVVALRLHLGGTQLAELDRELTISTSEKSTLTEQVEVETRLIAEHSRRISELSIATEELGERLDRDTTAAGLLETTAERLRRMVSIALERSRAASGRREAVIERTADLETERTEILDELVVVEGELSRSEGVTTTAESRFRRLEDEERAMATQNALSPEGALAAVRGELSALQSALGRDRTEIATIERRIDMLGSHSDDENQEISRINHEIRSMDANVSHLQAEYERASKAREVEQRLWSKSESALDDARIQIASARARLEAVAAALEGRHDPTSRSTVETAEGALGSLVSQLDIPKSMEAAVSAALGVWADAVAFADADGVHDAVSLVKGRGGGSVSVVSSMSHAPTPAAEVAAKAGLETLIDRLGPGHHRGLAARLLGDVILVEGWSAGWALIARHPSLRAVTPDGDLISVSGVRVGDADGVGAGMLDTAEVAVERASTELARAQSIHTAAKRSFERARDAERQTLERLEQAETALAGRSEAMSRLQVSVRAMEGEMSRLDQRRAALAEAIDSASERSIALEQRIQALEGEEADRVRLWEELEESRRQVADHKERARSEWQEATAAHRAVAERERLLRDRVERIETELRRVDPGRATEIDPAILDTVGILAKRGVVTLEHRIEELRVRQALVRDEHRSLTDELKARRAEQDARNASVGRARSRLGELDVRLTEIRLRRESVLEAIRRNADADEADALNAPRPDFAGADTDLEELMETKVTQLQRLGPINPLAAQEYADLEERHRFLSDQMADVESSRAELRKVIKALETEIHARFDRAFDEVANAYQKYFEVLFPGGRGRIRLVDSDGAEAGVAIDAQPHGKRVSQMTLLSGGERSLAALAFLFAVFEARPSPFYVLDEVEAALDDANLRRFLRIVDEFRQKAQLIIVTHQQQTMEAADVLYGVTMEPGGSSQAVRKEMRASVGVEPGI